MRINSLVAKAQKKPEEGWVMQDGTPWPGNNTRDHPGMIQVTFTDSSLSDNTTFGSKTKYFDYSSGVPRKGRSV